MFRQSVGLGLAEDVRELAVFLRQTGEVRRRLIGDGGTSSGDGGGHSREVEREALRALELTGTRKGGCSDQGDRGYRSRIRRYGVR